MKNQLSALEEFLVSQFWKRTAFQAVRKMLQSHGVVPGSRRPSDDN